MIALKLLGGRLLRFLKSLPWQVWLALAVAAAVFFGVRYHNGAVEDARKAGDKAGYARASGEFVEKLRKIEAKANDIAAIARKKNDEEARSIAGRADDLRMRGAGKASCPGAVPAAPARRPNAPGGQPLAPLDQVPDGTGDDIIGLPFAATVAGAEVCDLNRAEVLSWREWHKKLSAKP